MVNTTLQIRAWAESKKNLPGKFTGSTGVNILKADQLGPDDPRFSVWAKKVCWIALQDLRGKLAIFTWPKVFIL